MKEYKISEIFLSLKGEGVWIGHPMLFLRFGRCNLNCEGCDTPQKDKWSLMTSESILRKLKSLRTKRGKMRLVVTGGEPLLQLDADLVKTLVQNEFVIHLETNGTLCNEEVFENLSWIAVSPKRRTMVNLLTLEEADELKVPITFETKDEEVLAFETMVGPTCRLYVQPWKDENFEKSRKRAEEFCKKHTNWSYSVQVHKLMGWR